DRARASDNDEAALGLRLMCPRVGERAPSRLVFRQTAFVAGDGHAVFVDFQAGRLVNDGRDFDRRSPVVEPRSESHAVAQIIQHRSPLARLYHQLCGFWRSTSSSATSILSAR